MITVALELLACTPQGGPTYLGHRWRDDDLAKLIGESRLCVRCGLLRSTHYFEGSPEAVREFYRATDDRP